MASISKGGTLNTSLPKAYQPTDTSESLEEVHKNLLDALEWQDRLKKLMQWRRQARVAQAENRTQMAIDEDFYDGIQMDPEDLHILQQRGQPPLVFNVIKNTINWVMGTERKARIDYRVLPRNKAGADSAKSKTKLLKYIQDCCKGEFERSFAFDEMIKAGLGWLEIAARSNPECPVFIKAERWRNMWFDHLGLSNDGSDWRYVYREKWVDLDIAQGIFPERADELKGLADGVNSIYPYLPDDVVATDTASEFDLESDLDSLFGGTSSGSRERVKLIECWYRMPEKVVLMKMRDKETPYGALDGVIFRKDQPDHQYLVRGGYFEMTDVQYMMTVRCAIWAGSTYLQDMLTPYNHNRFPFVPIFCYRRKRDNMPYGVIRDARDPQSDLNKRRSRALVLLTGTRVLYEKEPIDDPDKFLDEINRPDGMAEVAKGGLQKIQVQRDLNLAQAHSAMAQENKTFIHDIVGVTYENEGKNIKDLSGVAIKSLQAEGQTSSGVFFDNYFFAFQNAGEILVSLEEQFFDEEKEIRITESKKKDEFVKINERTETGINNNILQSKSDFIIGKQDYRESIRVAMFQMLSQLIQSLAQSMPNVALALLDQVIEFMDELPNKDAMIARIREINKQNAPEDEMTPEQRAEYQKAKQEGMQEQAALKQLQMAMAQVELAIKQADAAGKKSSTVKNMVEAEMRRLDGFLKALEVAGQIAVNPQVVGAADQLIAEARGAGEPNNGGGQRQLSSRNQGGP